MMDGAINQGWINTSVNDLRSSLQCLGDERLVSHLPSLRATAAEAERLGHRTRAKLLRSAIQRAEVHVIYREATADEAARRGQKTREKLLRSYIRRAEQELRDHHGRPDVRAQR